MAKKLKKVDFRMDEELYERLNYIIELEDVKRSSWCRRAVEVRVESFFSDSDESMKREEDYERFKQKRAEQTSC